MSAWLDNKMTEVGARGKENKFATAFRKEFGFRPKHFDKEFGNPLVTPNRSG